ncbi:MAG: aromatic-ring-hydroxylating dioxygenase subunit beta [Burkholderiales bacterium]
MATPKKSAVRSTPPVAAKTPARRQAPAARVKQALAGGVVIEGTVKKGRTGAQAIAPDHSPRDMPRAVHAPDTGPAVAPADLHREVEQFLFRQSELLDGKYWQDWIDLFADDGHYWMPVSADQTDWDNWPSIFIEDKAMMEIRMGRVTHPNAWSQAPLWATNHVVGNVVMESVSRKEIVVRSRFHMMELRRDAIRHFGGTYRHTLVRTRQGLRIRLQRVDLFNGQAPFDYVLQVWV